MKKIVAICIIVFVSISFSGCLRSYYPVASMNSAPPMTSKLNYSGDNYSNHLNISTTIGNGQYEQEKYRLVKLGYIFSNTGDHYNFNIEGFGQGGSYDVIGVSEKFDGQKSFYGFGGNVSVLVNFKFDKFKLGIGTNLGLGIELGEFYDFKKKAQKEELITNSDYYLTPFVSAFPYLCYQFSESSSISSQLNIGSPGLLSPIIQYKQEPFSFWLCWIPKEYTWTDVSVGRVTFGCTINLGDINLNL